MRILLQSFETGMYLDVVGAWTDRLELARDFPNTVRATEVKIRHRLRHAFVAVVPETSLRPQTTRFPEEHSLASDKLQDLSGGNRASASSIDHEPITQRTGKHAP